MRPNRAARAAAKRPDALASGDRHALDRHRRGVGGIAVGEIVGGAQHAIHVDQVAGDGDLAHRMAELALLDDEAGGAAAVVAGVHVDAVADQLGHVEAVVDRGDHRLRRLARRAAASGWWSPATGCRRGARHGRWWQGRARARWRCRAARSSARRRRPRRGPRRQTPSPSKGREPRPRGRAGRR